MKGKTRNPGNEKLNLASGCSRIRAVIRFGDLEKQLKDARGLLFFSSVRWLERRLPVQILYWILRPHAFVRAALKGIPASMPLPACLGGEKPVQAVRESRMKGYLNNVLEYFPERLAEPKWMSRCRIEGLDHVRQARQAGRPVVLAFSHFGAYRTARFWLRAAGIPVATMIIGKAGDRAKLERREDRFSPFPGVPTTFYLDQLREANEFLAAGNSLLIAIDNATGKQMNVPAGGGWIFQMAAGAVRLAIRHQAELISCVVIDEGRWRFHIKLGRPVPAEYLAAGADWVPAGKHLLDEMLPHFRNHPDQCSNQLIKYFQPSPPPGK
jgi:lauroyl/myristoyl acyltransferase